MTVLAVSSVSKLFPGVRALDQASFELQAGSIHALLGENGAGKSTLIKILTGVYTPEDGSVMVDGQTRKFATPRDALLAGISAVHQERNLISYFSAAENIMLESLPNARGMIKFSQMHEQAAHWLESLNVGIDPRTPVSKLSVAQMQLVEIAKALAQQAHILLLDEPTASLTPHETKHLFELLRQLRDNGTALVFVSHKLEEVFELCDRVTVLRDGKNACQSQPLAELDRQLLVKLMIGREEQIPERPNAGQHANEQTSDSPALEVRNVDTLSGHRNISFTLNKGEILGLYGLVGSGRSEFAKALIGLDTISGGEIRLDSKLASIKDVRTALEQYRMGYISEDRKSEGLILEHSITSNVAITIWDELKNSFRLLGNQRETAAAQPPAERLQVRTPSLQQQVGNLSGGNQQKVSVAKWLAAQASVLIIDEPTVGIDINTKNYLHELIWQLASEGTAILLISSDMPEMTLLADRILIMNDFRLTGEVENTRDYESVSQAIMRTIHQQDTTQEQH